MQMQMETNLTAATKEVVADEQVRIVCRTASTNARPGAKNHSVQRDQTPK